MKKKALVGHIGIKLLLILTILPLVCTLSPSLSVGQPIVLGVPISRGYPDGLDAERGITPALGEINAKGAVDVAWKMRPLNIEIMDTRTLEPGVLVAKALLGDEKFGPLKTGR